MQRLIEWLQVISYLIGILAVLAAAGYALTVMHEISSSLKQERLQHEQMRKDHATELKDHEERRERSRHEFEVLLQDHQRLMQQR